MRPEVLAFARLMEAKLREHDDDRGSGWKYDDPEQLLERIWEEANELHDALEGFRSAEGESGDRTPAVEKAAMNAAIEATDIGNFAMMIADVLGVLDTHPESEDTDG